MTGRQRLEAILHRQPTDQLAWTTLVDAATLDALPGPLRGCSGLDLYRHIGCDILLLNGWGCPRTFASPRLDWDRTITVTRARDGDRATCEIRTPAGTLTRLAEKGHPIKYYVETVDDLAVYRALWEGAHYVETDDAPVLAALDEQVGHDGVVTRFWGPSTIPRLLEVDMGTVNFYYLQNDHPDEMDALIRLVHEKELKAFEILAPGPCQTVILCENTSTFYISPAIYRLYNGQHVRDFVDIVRAAGKTPIIHMCGHIKNILPDIKHTGLDGVHGLTPPRTGDTPWELALDVLGDDQIIIGVLDPYVFEAAPIEAIAEELDALYTPRLRRSNFVLWAGADGHRVPLERFQAVARWMERNGNRH